MLGLVLGITVGATAGASVVLAPNSVDGKAIKDRSLHFVKLSANGEQMIRDAWRYANGSTKVPEANLDPALDAKINAPITEARLDPALDAKINRPAQTTLASRVGTDDVIVITLGTTSTTCSGSYGDPRTSAGKL